MTENDQNEKLVAEIEVAAPIAFNTSMSDVIETEEPEVDQTPLPETSQMEVSQEEEVVQEEVPVEQPEIQESEEEDPYEDFSEAALITQALKKKRPDIFSDDVKKDLKWEDLIDNIDSYIANTLENGQEMILDNIGPAKDYVEFLLEGGDPKVIQDALQNTKYSQIDLEEASEEEKESVVKAMYKDLNLPEEEASALVETLKLSGKLDKKAAESVQHFDKKEKDILKAAKEEERRNKEIAEKQRQELVSNMNNIIDKGEILGLDLSDSEKKELKEAFFNPTEIVEVPDGKGGTVMRRFTKYQVLESEFKNSLEMQIAFGKLLLNGFKLSDIKEQGKRERDRDIIDILDRRKSSTIKKSNNAYLTPAMEYDVK